MTLPKVRRHVQTGSNLFEGFEDYLGTNNIPLRLAFTLEDYPFVISLWFIHLEDKLYCATQASAKVVQSLRKDKRCGFEIASEKPPYKGIRGRAEAVIVPALGEEILKKLLMRYLGSLEVPLAQKLLKDADTEVAIMLKPITLASWDFSKRMKDSI